jgi:3,4-dihydroxy 2-butanone 4-phosphate synthase/GTP cyclohydrolase II
VQRRPVHTEAAVDLESLEGREPGGVLCELVNADGTMQRGEQLRAFADEHGLAFVTIADLVAFRRHHERLVTRVSAAPIPTPDGTFVAHAYRSTLDEVEHVAFVLGDVAGSDPVLVRVHSECLTGDVLGSLRCDCGLQLAAAREAIAAAGRGVLVYLRGHEGRGIGLGHKLRAYELQDNGYDTVDANLALGLPVDSRDYGIGAQILTDLGVSKVRLMTNNPAKYTGLGDYGITITERVPLIVAPTVHSRRYLETKRDRLHHQLDDPVDGDEGDTDPDLTLADLNPADIEEAS